MVQVSPTYAWTGRTSGARDEPADRQHQACGRSLLIRVVYDWFETPAHVVAQDQKAEVVKRDARGSDLIEDLRTRMPVVIHKLDALDLTLESAQAGANPSDLPDSDVARRPGDRSSHHFEVLPLAMSPACGLAERNLNPSG